MATITGQVKYVNQPKEGKKKGSIKLADGTMIGVWPDKLSMFTAGITYEIEYTEDGQWKTAKTAKPIGGNGGGASSAPAPQNGNGNGYYRPTSPQDAERMYVTSLMNAFIQAGKIDLREDSLSAATNFLRRAWQRTFGRDGQATH